MIPLNIGWARTIKQFIDMMKYLENNNVELLLSSKRVSPSAQQRPNAENTKITASVVWEIRHLSAWKAPQKAQNPRC